jgi:hypothetical protein
MQANYSAVSIEAALTVASAIRRKALGYRGDAATALGGIQIARSSELKWC